MISVMFVCYLVAVSKEIKVELITDKLCKTYINEKVVGSSTNSALYCAKLGNKVKADLERKGFKCSLAEQKK